MKEGGLSVLDHLTCGNASVYVEGRLGKLGIKIWSISDTVVAEMKGLFYVFQYLGTNAHIGCGIIFVVLKSSECFIPIQDWL